MHTHIIYVYIYTYIQYTYSCITFIKLHTPITAHRPFTMTPSAAPLPSGRVTGRDSLGAVLGLGG